jgi:NAD(P)-dependent dehydrogenase (short-subunit alcohol dehydrogenase family)
MLKSPTTGEVAPMTTAGKTAPRAFVSGASRGIGKAIAVSLAAAGHDVAITVETGFLATEGTTIEQADFGVDVANAARPESIGEVVAWLVAHTEQAGQAGRPSRRRSN